MSDIDIGPEFMDIALGLGEEIAEEEIAQLRREDEHLNCPEKFSIDPEFMGIALGLGEEIAEEEIAQLRREDEHPNCPEKFSEPERGYTQRKKMSRGKKRKLPAFEQYVSDVISGKRGLEDHIIPGKYDIFSSDPLPEIDEDDIYITKDNVVIYNYSFVSRKYITILEHILVLHDKRNVHSIKFDLAGFPKKNQIPILGAYVSESKSIILNMQRHFDNAARISLHMNKNMSIRALLWHSMIFIFLHEIFHSFLENPSIDREILEEAADLWADDELVKLAENIDIEPPDFKEEKYFSHLFNQMAQKEARQGNRTWVKKQTSLLDANVMYYDEDTHIAITTAKRLWGIMPPGMEENGASPLMAAHFQEEDKNIHSSFAEEERKEDAVNEAIEKGYYLKLEFTNPKTDRLYEIIIQPTGLFYHKGFMNVKGLRWPDKREKTIRLSDIKKLKFFNEPGV